MYNKACDVDGCNVWKCAAPLLSTKQNSIRFRRIQTEAVVWKPTVKICETGFEPGDWKRRICGGYSDVQFGVIKHGYHLSIWRLPMCGGVSICGSKVSADTYCTSRHERLPVLQRKWIALKTPPGTHRLTHCCYFSAPRNFVANCDGLCTISHISPIQKLFSWEREIFWDPGKSSPTKSLVEN